MRLVSYNIQYSLGLDGRYDLPRSLATVRAADIICLQEVERNWRRSGMEDQPELIEKLMSDRYCVYGAQFDANASYRYADGRIVNRRRQFGQMTLSRWPIVASRTHVFPKLDTGPRLNLVTGALETVIAAPDGPVRVFNIHLSDAAASERLMQIRHLMDLLYKTASEGSIWNGSEADAAHWEADQPPPPMPPEAILLGDFNAEPASLEYAALQLGTVLSEAGAAAPSEDRHRYVDSWVAAGYDIAAGVTYRANADQGTSWDQRLDYCFLPEPLVPRLRDSWIDEAAMASDHQPLWVELA
jgi:endonuclease/exonuclease/phosphatase family metal-dependent hydrolase